MALKQIHGPYRLVAGFHTEDVPSLGPDGKPLAFKIKVVNRGDNSLTAECGTVLAMVDQGVMVRFKGAVHAAYVDGCKVAASDVKAGDQLELAHEANYGPPSVPERLRPKGLNAVYAPFMSSVELDKLFNGPGAEFRKYVKVPSPAPAKPPDDETAALKKRVAELESEKLAAVQSKKK